MHVYRFGCILSLHPHCLAPCTRRHPRTRQFALMSLMCCYIRSGSTNRSHIISVRLQQQQQQQPHSLRNYADPLTDTMVGFVCRLHLRTHVLAARLGWSVSEERDWRASWWARKSAVEISTGNGGVHIKITINRHCYGIV